MQPPLPRMRLVETQLDVPLLDVRMARAAARASRTLGPGLTAPVQTLYRLHTDPVQTLYPGLGSVYGVRTTSPAQPSPALSSPALKGEHKERVLPLEHRFALLVAFTRSSPRVGHHSASR